MGSFTVELRYTKSLGSTKDGLKNVNVLLNIYDGVTKKFVTSVNGEVTGANGRGWATVNDVEMSHSYIVKIDYVSCDR